MKSEPKRIGGIIEETINRLKLREGLKKGDIFSKWEEIVGKEISAKANPVSLKNGFLVLKTEGATWSQELSFMEEELIEKINNHVKEGLVKKIRFKTK